MSRHFGFEEANRLVPLLSETFEGVRPLAARVQELLQSPLDEAGEKERDALVAKIQERLQPLLEMGIEVKAIDGLVDLRALRNGKTVYLCWRFGEEKITHWHDLESGFAGRRPIANSDEFMPSYLS
jgi:hypothetical protein